jgi:predicted dehydrogenase
MSAPAAVRIGILGAARIAPLAMVKPARLVPEASIVAIAARNPARAHAFASKHAIPRVHETYEALLADPDLDAVYVPLPNHLHYEWSIRALEAGKHVLCEKPMASNAREARQMAEVAAATGRLLVEAFHYRYHPLAARLKQIVASGELGTVRRLEAQLCLPLLIPGHIQYHYDLAGGATMDLGCYTVNLIRYLAEAEPEVRLARARLISSKVDRFMEAELAFSDGRTARLVCSILSLALLRSKARVVGDHGELRVSGPFHPQYYHRLTVRGGGGVRSERVVGEATFTHQLRAFVQAVRGEAVMPTDALDAVANMRVIDAIYTRAGLPLRGVGQG